MWFYGYDSFPFAWPLFGLLIIWSAVWKGVGLWKSGRNNQLGWFIAIFILNTAGILPIIYLLAFQKKKVESIMIPKMPAKKKAKKKAKKSKKKKK